MLSPLLSYGDKKNNTPKSLTRAPLLAVQKPKLHQPRQLQPMALRVIHKLQHHTLGVARQTAPKPHIKYAAPCASLTRTPKRPWHSAVQSVVPLPRPLPRPTGGTSHAAAARGRGPGAAARGSCQPRTPASLPSQPPPSDRPAPRAPMQRSAPDAGANAQPARLVVPIRMRHKLVPQPRAQVRPHLPGEA